MARQKAVNRTWINSARALDVRRWRFLTAIETQKPEVWKALREGSTQYSQVLGNLGEHVRATCYVVTPGGEILQEPSDIADGFADATAAQIAQLKSGLATTKSYVPRQRSSERDRWRRSEAGLPPYAASTAELQAAIDAHPIYDPRRVLESDYLKMVRAYVNRVNVAARKIGVEPLRRSEARDWELLAKWQLDSRSAESLAGIPELRAERRRLKRAHNGASSESERNDLSQQLEAIEDRIVDAEHEARRLRDRMPKLAAEIGLPPRRPPRRGRPRKSGS